MEEIANASLQQSQPLKLETSHENAAALETRTLVLGERREQPNYIALPRQSTPPDVHPAQAAERGPFAEEDSNSGSSELVAAIRTIMVQK